MVIDRLTEESINPKLRAYWYRKELEKADTDLKSMATQVMTEISGRHFQRSISSYCHEGMLSFPAVPRALRVPCASQISRLLFGKGVHIQGNISHLQAAKSRSVRRSVWCRPLFSRRIRKQTHPGTTPQDSCITQTRLNNGKANILPVNLGIQKHLHTKQALARKWWLAVESTCRC